MLNRYFLEYETDVYVQTCGQNLSLSGRTPRVKHIIFRVSIPKTYGLEVCKLSPPSCMQQNTTKERGCFVS